MSKFRSRKIVDAIRWMPGVEIPGVTNGGNYAFVSHKGRSLFDGPKEYARLIRPGDYVIIEDGKPEGVWPPDEFLAEYEDIGG